jgi:precorrin-3B C17-methyltransferase
VPEALQALINAQVIVGYKTYLDLIPDLIEGKTVISSGMKKEVQRCQTAIDHALNGAHVALVSSGDAGIYGMAGLVFDLCRERHCHVKTSSNDSSMFNFRSSASNSEGDFTVEVIPGVAAFNAAASLLGAPLMHDFASISLSDLLTPWDLIEKRLNAAALADFVIALYNPRSKSRPHLLEQAQQILLHHRSPDTPVGIVRKAMRKEEWKHLTTLKNIPLDEVDMQSILIVGNSQTYVWDGWMVTPRGYMDKYSIEDKSCL